MHLFIIFDLIGIERNGKKLLVTLKAELSLMNGVDHLPEDGLLCGELLEPLHRVDVIGLLLDQSCEVVAMRPVNLVDPDGIEELQEQEVGDIDPLLDLFRLINVVPQQSLLEGLLHDEVLRYFLKEVSQVSLFLHVIFEKEEVILVERGSHRDLIKQIAQLAAMGLTDQHILPINSKLI